MGWPIASVSTGSMGARVPVTRVGVVRECPEIRALSKCPFTGPVELGVCGSSIAGTIYPDLLAPKSRCSVPPRFGITTSSSRQPTRTSNHTQVRERALPGRYVCSTPIVNLCGEERPGGDDQAPPIRRTDHSTARRHGSPSRLHSWVSLSWTERRVGGQPDHTNRPGAHTESLVCLPMDPRARQPAALLAHLQRRR
jgi:hypothetical protein